MTQRHAACALWGLSDGKDGIYDKQIAEAGAIPHLIAMLHNDDAETRGFAAACLLCLCKDRTAHPAILEAGAGELLQQLSYGPNTWLRGQVVEMLKQLEIPVPDPNNPPQNFGLTQFIAPSVTGQASPPAGASAAASGEGGADSPLSKSPSGSGSPHGKMPPWQQQLSPSGQSARPALWTARKKFHFFSFQIHGTTGYNPH